jgi:hypothetical protein
MNNGRNKVVICGSMTHYDAMIDFKNSLSNADTEIIIPSNDAELGDLDIKELKKKCSISHFKKVSEDTTTTILVVNLPKNGILNYIGANTFAEIAFAFFYQKKIFVLEDIYEVYKDELCSWDAISLNGNISLLSSHLNESKLKVTTK